MWKLCLIFLTIICLAMGSFLLEPLPKRADLRVGYLSINTLDPQMMRAMEDVRFSYALYEGLLTFDPFTFEILPGAAERYERLNDGMTYRFHLRREGKWSDGRPLTARDFVDAWRLGLMPDTAPTYIAFIQMIKGGKAFTAWCQQALEAVMAIKDPVERLARAEARIVESKRQFKQLVGVRVLDDYTIEVDQETYLPYFTEILASWPLFPLPMHVMDQVSAIDPHSMMLRRDPQWTRPNRDPKRVTMVSNGPYRLDQWRFKRRLRLEANTHYWNDAQTKVRSVECTHFKTLHANFIAYESGAVDYLLRATSLPYSAALIKQGREKQRADVHTASTYSVYYFAFNNRATLSDGRPNPFADPRVRRAFTLATNKKAIVEQVTGLYEQVAQTMIPPGSILNYRSPKGLSYDLTKARALMAEAGYPEGRGFPMVEMIYNTESPLHVEVTQALANMWQKSLGIKTTQEAQEWKVFIARRRRGEFMVARSGWGGDYMDPTTFLDLCRTGGGNNDGGFSDAHYDGLLTAADQIADPQARLDQFTEAERYLMEEQTPLLPLFFTSTAHLFDADRLKGLSLHPRELQMFHWMEVTKP